MCDGLAAVAALAGVVIEKALFHEMRVSEVYPCPFKSLLLSVFRDDSGVAMGSKEETLIGCVETAASATHVKVCPCGVK